MSQARITRRPSSPVATRLRRGSGFLIPLGVAALAILIWQGICELFDVPVYLVPRPTDVIRVLYTKADVLASNALPTLYEALLGFTLGAVAAVSMSVAFVYWKALETGLMPIAVFIQTIPIVGIAPLLVILMGTGYLPKITISALITFFPILVNTTRGLQAVDAKILDLMKMLSATRSEIFWKVRIFCALPFLFAALKIAITASVVGAIIAEWIGSQVGLGYLIIQSTYNFNTPLLYATMVVASTIAVALFSSVSMMERRLIKWT